MQHRFGPFELDRGRRALLREGTEILISPKALRLLEILVTAAPEALSRNALYDALWGETFVHEANLPNLISELRSALGDDARNPRFIRTVSRFGYRFEGTVEAKGPPATDPVSRARILWAGREYPLKSGPNLLGRHAEADVRLDLAGVSRRHATITVLDGSTTIEDHGSKNGTFVRGSHLSGPASLTSGETIRLGSVSIIYQERSMDATTVTDLHSQVRKK